jgi:hypothetical protein
VKAVHEREAEGDQKRKPKKHKRANRQRFAAAVSLKIHQKAVNRIADAADHEQNEHSDAAGTNLTVKFMPGLPEGDFSSR